VSEDDGRSRKREGSVIARGLSRAAGGALIFSLPMLMTMEFWWLGFSLDRYRLTLLMVVAMPLLVILSRHSGFERTPRLRDDVRDAFIAYGIGMVTSAIILAVFGLLTVTMPWNEIVGKIAIQSVPASIGALLGRSQLGGGRSRASRKSEERNYFSELFLMCAGALFLSLNMAPTEEMILISYKMTEWHGIVLVVLSILLMHGFVFAMQFKNEPSLPEGTPWWSAFARFTLPGYVLALVISLFILWMFGRTDGLGATSMVMMVIVLGFPAAIGAAAARLIL
jgi:putative integral membrane protein (TIGR02587 family)